MRRLFAFMEAILWSGGKESNRLLDMFPAAQVIHFYDRLHPEVEKMIKERDLNVLSWSPAQRYLIPFDGTLALVSEYSFGQGVLPVLRDVVVGGECEMEKLSRQRTPYFDYPFEKTYWGYRKADELHPVMPVFERETQLGPTKLIAPLYDLTDKEFEHDMTLDDSIRMCESCWLALENWDQEASLNRFTERFGYRKVA